MEWISVKDRLPEPKTEVLLWVAASTDPWRKTYSRYDLGVYDPDVYQPFWQGVTYWMPLPEAPKEEKQI